MNDKIRLLEELSISRDGVDSPAKKPLGKYVAGGILLAVALLLCTVFFTARAQRIPVRIVAVTAAGEGRQEGASLLDATGYVIARRQATISTKVTGAVREILFEEGERVSAGQIIARLDTSTIDADISRLKSLLRSAEVKKRTTEKNLENVNSLYARSKELVRHGWISADAYDHSKYTFDEARNAKALAQSDLEVARAALRVAEEERENFIIRAPFSGVITVKAAQPGEIVSPVSAGGGYTRTGICTIVDMDSLEVEVDVSESYINRIYVGQAVNVRLNAYPDWQIASRVIAVIPAADRAKATIKVRVGFQEKDSRIGPEMGIHAAFQEKGSGNAPNPALNTGFFVPAEAVVSRDERGGTGRLFVVVGEQLEARDVALGLESARGRLVTAGVKAGDRVALGDFGEFKHGAKVKIQE